LGANGRHTLVSGEQRSLSRYPMSRERKWDVVKGFTWRNLNCITRPGETKTRKWPDSERSH